MTPLRSAEAAARQSYPICATDSGRGIVCSEACRTELDRQYAIVGRSKAIYALQGRKAGLPTSVPFMLGVLCLMAAVLAL